MSIILMSEKGQVTIPREIRKRLRIERGDPLVVEMDAQGGIHLRVATVLPVETYSEERLRDFAKEDLLSPTERKRVQKALHA